MTMNISQQASYLTPRFPVPSHRQLAWHKMELYSFLHFTVNTFTNKEWGYGDESPAIFNPARFNAETIVKTLADAGMKGVILTCKHHDGFCLWPTATTEHSVKHSPWKNGKGDMVREISEACRKEGLKFGIYLSPWDRNHKDYGSEKYITCFRTQLTELTTGYGELFEVWFDGANGGDGYYGGTRETRKIDRKNYYRWDEVSMMVRENQPNAVIFSDAGPDVRWVGNELGIAGDTCRSTITRSRIFRGTPVNEATAIDDAPQTFAEDKMVEAWCSDRDTLNRGDRKGEDWLPAECDTSIRPGWFFHESENESVKSGDDLFELYLKSTGRGASLLLNIPPDKNGEIHSADCKALSDFKKRREHFDTRALSKTAVVETTMLPCTGTEISFSSTFLLNSGYDYFIAAAEGNRKGEIIFRFSNPQKVKYAALRECLPLGERIDQFEVFCKIGNEMVKIGGGSSVGNLKVVELEESFTEEVKIVVVSSEGFEPALTMAEVYSI